MDEGSKLRIILEQGIKQGLEFISDSDARPEGGAHPRAHLWDSGSNAVEELNRIMTIRNRALARFGASNVREGEPWSTLRDSLVPIYLLHRYQTEAVSKLIGGVDYAYAVKGDGQKIAEIVPPEQQKSALNAILATLNAQNLTLSAPLLDLLPPNAFSFSPTRESFRGSSGLTFDSMAPVEAAANITLSLLLHPQRAHRLMEQHARNPKVDGFAEVTQKLINATWKAPRNNGLEELTQQVVELIVMKRLMALAVGESSSSLVRAQAFLELEKLRAYAKTLTGTRLAQGSFAVKQIDRFMADPKQVPVSFVEPPPGQPIGCEDFSGIAIP